MNAKVLKYIIKTLMGAIKKAGQLRIAGTTATLSKIDFYYSMIELFTCRCQIPAFVYLTFNM